MTRAIRVVGDIAVIPLTRGYEAVIDLIDLPLVAGHLWFVELAGKQRYAVRTDRSNGKQRRLRMHRVILGLEDQAIGRNLGDHCDGDGLNNRRINLRPATKSENNWNARTRKDSSTGLRGVHYLKRAKVWQARIMSNGKRITLGNHRSPEAASAAYAKASSELRGEFGRAA